MDDERTDRPDLFRAELRRLLETAPRKLIEVDSFVDHLFEGLVKMPPGRHRYGWLVAYDQVRPVGETEFMDSDGGGGRTWTVWTTDERSDEDES